MRPIIGIVGRNDMSYLNKSTICVFDNYRKSVINSGGNPILILPPQEIDYYNLSQKDIKKLSDIEKQMIIDQLNLCSGIIMPGGVKRFEYDDFICEYCNKNNIPLLGICMGMQIMCNYNNDNKNIKITEHFEVTHKVKINKNSKLYKILNSTNINVNSLHNYKVLNSGSYKVSATCGDVIEAIEKENPFNMGFQWHPEKNYDTDLASKKIFDAFIKSSISKKP